MRPSGRSRGSVPGRKNVTTLSRIAPLSTRVAGQQCIYPRRPPTAEWFEATAAGTSGLRVGASRGMLSPEKATRHIYGAERNGQGAIGGRGGGNRRERQSSRAR